MGNTGQVGAGRPIRQVAMFDLATDSKLRACDLVELRLRDVYHGSQIAAKAWIEDRSLLPDDYLFPDQITFDEHLSTRQYARIVKNWVESIGLDGVIMEPTQ